LNYNTRIQTQINKTKNVQLEIILEPI